MKQPFSPQNKFPTKNKQTNKFLLNTLRKQRYTMTFPTKEEVNFALRFETFDLPPYGKESSCNFKNILEGYVSAKTGYRLPNVHTLHNQVHIVVGGAMGDVSSAQTTPSFLFIIPLWIVFMRNGFASSTMYSSDTTKMTSLHHFILCILINRFLRSLSSSVMTTTMLTRMVSTHDVST